MLLHTDLWRKSDVRHVVAETVNKLVEKRKYGVLLDPLALVWNADVMNAYS